MYKWVEVNLDAIASNYQKVRNFVNKTTKILGVVKADAYGHGMIEAARELERQGVDYLGVTEIIEGIQLRDAGIHVPILVFSPILPEDIGYLREYELTISIADLEIVKLLQKEEIPVQAHIKLETGLGRTGIKHKQITELYELLTQAKNIKIEGIYTHLATAMWQNSSFALKQGKEFVRIIEELESMGLSIALKHICNSAGIVKFPEMHLNMVRAGTILYGQAATNIGTENAWQLKAQITYINELPKGHSIGYERTYILKRNSLTALVPIGFAHGFSVEPIPRVRSLHDLIIVLIKTVLRFFNHNRVKTFAQIKDKSVPVLGKVGMQLTILDVTDVPDIKVGDVVDLPGRRTNINPLIPKVFLKDGKPIKVQRLTEHYEDFTMVAK